MTTTKDTATDLGRNSEKKTATATAGRELDVLVAERVLGYDPQYIHTHKGGAAFPTDLTPSGWIDVAPIRHFSTDIAAAWEVAEKYIAAGCAAWVEGDGHTGYRAGVTSGNGRFESEGESPAHAICLAALRAVAAPSEVDFTEFPPSKSVAVSGPEGRAKVNE